MNQQRSIKLRDLLPSRNVRSDLGDLSELTESIREHGILQPVRVRPSGSGQFQIIAGHRRAAAAKRAGLSEVPAVIADESDRTVAIQNVVENLQRENLSPLDLARGVRELESAFGLDIDQIAKALSKSPAQVRTLVRASRLPDEVLARLQSGEGGTQGLQGLTIRHIERLVARMPLDLSKSDGSEVQQTASVVTELLDETERRGIRINAHQADEVGRQLRGGKMTVQEAVDLVTANPERFRYGRGFQSLDELEADTWAGYREMHRQLAAVAYRLRPEIAISFADRERADLSQSIAGIIMSLSRYRDALETRPSSAPTPHLRERN